MNLVGLCMVTTVMCVIFTQDGEYPNTVPYKGLSGLNNPQSI